jgi:hypothetical protein
MAEVEPSHDPAVLGFSNMDKNDTLYDKTDESGEESQAETSDDELLDGLGLNEVDMAELKEALQKISRALDTLDGSNTGCELARSLNSLAIKQ